MYSTFHQYTKNIRVSYITSINIVEIEIFSRRQQKLQNPEDPSNIPPEASQYQQGLEGDHGTRKNLEERTKRRKKMGRNSQEGTNREVDM
jgi:hypothetical protein